MARQRPALLVLRNQTRDKEAYWKGCLAISKIVRAETNSIPAITNDRRGGVDEVERPRAMRTK